MTDKAWIALLIAAGVGVYLYTRREPVSLPRPTVVAGGAPAPSQPSSWLAPGFVPDGGIQPSYPVAPPTTPGPAEPTPGLPTTSRIFRVGPDESPSKLGRCLKEPAQVIVDPCPPGKLRYSIPQPAMIQQPCAPGTANPEYGHGECVTVTCPAGTVMRKADIFGNGFPTTYCGPAADCPPGSALVSRQGVYTQDKLHLPVMECVSRIVVTPDQPVPACVPENIPLEIQPCPAGTGRSVRETSLKCPPGQKRGHAGGHMTKCQNTVFLPPGTLKGQCEPWSKYPVPDPSRGYFPMQPAPRFGYYIEFASPNWMRYCPTGVKDNVCPPGQHAVTVKCAPGTKCIGGGSRCVPD